MLAAYGAVQRVGYRYVVEDSARRLGLTGYVENLRDGSVRIVVEGPKNLIEQLRDRVRVDVPPIRVERVDIDYQSATGEFDGFQIKAGDIGEEMMEGFGAGLRYVDLVRGEMRDARGDIQGMHRDMTKSFHTMAKRYDSISKALLETRKELVGTRRELRKAIDRLSRLIEEFISRRRQS